MPAPRARSALRQVLKPEAAVVSTVQLTRLPARHSADERGPQKFGQCGKW